MTHQEMLSRIAKLNAGDNYKLVGYLLSHGIDVQSVKPEAITVKTRFTKHGIAFDQDETIPATMPAVRAYLGY